MLSGRTTRPAACTKHSKMSRSSSAFAVAAFTVIAPDAYGIPETIMRFSSRDIIDDSHQGMLDREGNHKLNEAPRAVRYVFGRLGRITPRMTGVEKSVRQPEWPPLGLMDSSP